MSISRITASSDPHALILTNPGRWAKPAFWRAWIVAAILTLFFVALLNFLIDPFAIYGTGFFRPYRLNAYINKVELFQNQKTLPQVLILGSSRAGSLDPDVVRDLTGKTCFNWSVPSAGVEIMTAALRMAIEKYGAPVDTVIVTVDPEVFSPGLWIHPQALLAPMYAPYLDSPASKPSFKTRITNIIRLVSYEQTKSSISVIRRELGDKSQAETKLYRDDGFALYIVNEDQIRAGKYNLEKIITERLLTYPSDNLCITASTKLSSEREKKWVDFLDYCANHNIRVYAYLPPAQPEYIAMLHGFGADPVIDEIRTFLQTTIRDHGFTFRDFTDLASIDGDPTQFYDEVHMRKANNDRLLKKLLATSPSP